YRRSDGSGPGTGYRFAWLTTAAFFACPRQVKNRRPAPVTPFSQVPKEGRPMECLEQLASPGLEATFYRLYRDFFNRADKKRRWSLQDDIPWGQVNPSLDPAVGDVVESFCAVELFLPDYLASGMALFRPSRACTWFYANWGYEESKHSLALGDWLLRSG